ncbi:CHAT domain-containing protein [Streptomyces sp. NPDC050564]|uniref:CHAT domain-containing WD40 repeat protein n=1 Tax=Streptomyces sp. NPDC050564 TaxID=3365631 RepID=UPI0037B65270
MRTVDFQAEIASAGPGVHQVTLRTADGAEASADGVRLPVGAEELRILSARIPDAILASSAVVRRSAPPEERPVQELGRILFDTLFAGEGRALFAAARQRAAERDRSLRLVLRVRPPELARLPWEFLFDSAESSYVCTTMPLVRRPQVATPQRPLAVAAPLRILCMAARPDDLEPLAVRAERDRLGGALAGLQEAGLIELGWVEGETWRALRTALTRRGPWHILHFIGHGGFDPVTQEGTLALAGEEGGTYQLGAENLAMMLHDHRSLRLVVLNACETGRSAAADPFSSMGGALLRVGVPAALAMQYAISDRAAVEFGRSFYEGLAHRLPVDTAVTEARQAIRLALPGTLEWGTPVLYMRAAEGVLFDVDPQPAKKSVTVGQPSFEGGEPADRAVPIAAPSSSYIPFEGARSAQAASRHVTRVDVPKRAWSLAFSPDSSRLVIGCEKWLAVVVNLRGRQLCEAKVGGYVASAAGAVQSFFLYQDRVVSVCFDRTGDTFATVAGTTVRRWSSATGRRVSKSLLGRVSYTDTVALADGGQIYAAVYREMHTALVLTGPAGRRLPLPHTGDVLDLAFSGDSTRIAAGMRGPLPQDSDRWHSQQIPGDARVWNVASGTELCRLPHEAGVSAVALSSDGTRIATASGSLAQVWEVPTGRLLLRLPHHGDVISLAFGPDANRLATIDGSIATVWDLRAERAVWEHHALRARPTAVPVGIHGLGSVAYSPDGTHIAVLQGSEVHVIDLEAIGP